MLKQTLIIQRDDFFEWTTNNEYTSQTKTPQKRGNNSDETLKKQIGKDLLFEAIERFSKFAHLMVKLGLKSGKATHVHFFIQITI